MKFKIKVGYLLKQAYQIGMKEPWWEEYSKDVEDPRKWAEETIERFNNTLRPGEFPRKLLDIVILDKDLNEEHSWKKTNYVTIKKGRSYYDTYICEYCGITSKRFGIGGNFVIDNKYGAKVYWKCDTAIRWLEKKKKK